MKHNGSLSHNSQPIECLVDIGCRPSKNAQNSSKVLDLFEIDGNDGYRDVSDHMSLKIKPRDARNAACSSFGEDRAMSLLRL